MLEELSADYDAHLIHIGKGDQFTSGFTAINPNSKIPALVDKNGPGGEPIKIFETASIMLYLADKFHCFMPTDPRLKTEAMNWIFWQMGGFGPMCGQFGHFFVYAPADKVDARDYGVARYGMEVQRLCSVLDKHLEGRTYLVGEEYTVADMCSFTWFNHLVTGYKHPSGADANSFLSISQYTNAMAWRDRIFERPAVKRGLTVCMGPVTKPWLQEEKPVSG
jgi:GST-like protein